MRPSSRNPELKPRRLLPYLIALLLLAWVLGSLARSGTGGGSLLSSSYWLVYAVELLPVIALGVMIVFTAFLLMNAKFFSDALGSGMTRRRKLQKKKSLKIQAVVWIAAWAAVLIFLEVRCRGLTCNSSNTPQMANVTQNFVSGGGPAPSLPFLDTALAIGSLIDTNVFALAFLGLVTIGSVIMVRAVLVHLEEVHKEKVELFETVQEHGRQAVQAAIRILDETIVDDPRGRIQACYLKMIKAASDLGAPVGADKTARELEKGIRGMFLLKGPGIARLTGLFEEARYSLHRITEEDSRTARESLVEISEELNRSIILEA